jgi:hypothetical protein
VLQIEEWGAQAGYPLYGKGRQPYLPEIISGLLKRRLRKPGLFNERYSSSERDCLKRLDGGGISSRLKEGNPTPNLLEERVSSGRQDWLKQTG